MRSIPRYAHERVRRQRGAKRQDPKRAGKNRDDCRKLNAEQAVEIEDQREYDMRARGVLPQAQRECCAQSSTAMRRMRDMRCYYVEATRVDMFECVRVAMSDSSSAMASAREETQIRVSA